MKQLLIFALVAFSILASAQKGDIVLKPDPKLTSQQRKDFEALLKYIGMENLSLSVDVEVFNQDLKERGSRPLAPEHAAVYPQFAAEHNGKLVGTYIQEVNWDLRSEAIKAAPEVIAAYIRHKDFQRHPENFSMRVMLNPADSELLNCAPKKEVDDCDSFGSTEHRRWEDLTGQYKDCLIGLADKVQRGQGMKADPQCANNIRTAVRGFLREALNYPASEATTRPATRPSSRGQP